MVLNFKSTEEIKVPKTLVEQVIGQDNAVEVTKKSAAQRRHVLLIGEPGTGKSMLGVALAEMLPKEKLTDIIAFPNPNDENTPLVRVVPAGRGRELVAKARIQSSQVFKNQNLVMIILVLIVTILPIYFWKIGSIPDVVFAASIITSVILIASFGLFLNLGKRIGNPKILIPKVIVDNFNKKQAPFYDATGAHAGALLGDVLHDPFQCFIDSDIHVKEDISGPWRIESIPKVIDTLFSKHEKDIIKNEEGYEAIFLKRHELFVLGELHYSLIPVEVLSCNRQTYQGTMIKLITSTNRELIVTPEHKISVNKNGKIAYVAAKDIKKGDEVVAKAEDIIIDEQDIINTYPQEQRDLAASYYQCMGLSEQKPSWGYKRIATKLGVSYGRTRWWWDNDESAPVPVQTIEWLKKLGLIPLKIDNPKLPLLAKVLGSTFGDGGIFQNLNGIFLSSYEKDAVEEFSRDLEKVFNLKQNENSRIIEGGVYGHSWCYQNTNRNIIRFFLALGAPKGNKTKIELRVPWWISLLENIEDEFYGSFFGGELGSSSLHKDKNRLTTLEVGITGPPKFDKNRVEFLKSIETYLLGKQIKCNQLYKRRLDENSVIYRLQIAKNMDNVLLFLMNIRLNYCKYKTDRLYKALGQWAELKKGKYYELLQRGYGAESAMNLLKLTPNSLYLLLNNFGPKPEATT